MGAGWWMASDHKWYPPELHPDVFHTAPTEEIPQATGDLPPPPPPHLYQPPTEQVPIPATQVAPGPSAPGRPAPGDPTGSGGDKRSSGTSRSTIVIIALSVLVVVLAGGLVASLLASGSSGTDDGGDPAPVETFPATTSVIAPTTRPTTTPPVESTTPPETTTSVAPTTTLVPLPTQPPGDDRNPTMPDVICIELPEAKKLASAAGAGSVRTFDASGDGRRQIIHGNWIVVSQDPRPGDPVAGREVNLGVLKKGETTAC